MDAVKFIEERRRMYQLGCIKHAINDYNTKAETVVAEVEQWSKEHPRKTRQSVFPEQWLEARIDKTAYIDREWVRAHVKTYHPNDEKWAVIGGIAIRLIHTAIDNAPVADVVPVVHAKWTHLGGDEWCCSVCGFVITTEGSCDKPAKKYCEECGAKMDGGTT